MTWTEEESLSRDILPGTTAIPGRMVPGRMIPGSTGKAANTWEEEEPRDG